MPKTNRREKETAASGAKAQSVQNPAPIPPVSNRPRTRYWLKQQEGREGGQAASVPTSTGPQTSVILHRRGDRRSKIRADIVPEAAAASPEQERDREQRPTKSVSRTRHKTNQLDAKSSPKKKPREKLETQRSRRKPSTKVPAKRSSRQTKATTKGHELTAWLSELEPTSPEGLEQAETAFNPSNSSDLDRSDMDSSSTSRNTGEDGSTTTKLQSSRNSNKLTETKLRLRRINREATADGRLQHLKSILHTSLPERALKDIPHLRAIAEEFVRQVIENPNDSCYSYIDEFSFRFDEGKSVLHYPVVNSQYFEADLKRCMARNEAVLQRTIMIHIINRHWLGKMFDWNTEGQWSQPSGTRIPSREDDDVSQPRPDLAISFTLKSFTGAEDDSAPIPAALEKCMAPDGVPRCFPFLFFEVKKAASDLQEAFLTNLHSASQALYNIYSWMIRTNHEDKFFKEVRVFSIAFNAKDLFVRVHRSEKISTGILGFRFDEFKVLNGYTKDDACSLVKTILTDYAERELHPILKSTFDQVVKEEDERVAASKRKAMEARNSSSKRSRRAESDVQSAVQHTGTSFEMGNLGT